MIMDDERRHLTEDPDDELIETQWTSAALAAYRASADHLVQQLLEHVRLTGERQGAQRELGEHFASAERLQEAVNAFAEAEFDWCGSFPVRTELSNEPEEPQNGFAADPALEEAPVVSVMGRWDYLVTDGAALIDHGRNAYLQAWPQDTDDDAAVRVADVQSAVREILHAAELPKLEAAPGLQPLLSALELRRHAGTGMNDFTEDPFALLYE